MRTVLGIYMPHKHTLFFTTNGGRGLWCLQLFPTCQVLPLAASFRPGFLSGATPPPLRAFLSSSAKQARVNGRNRRFKSGQTQPGSNSLCQSCLCAHGHDPCSWCPHLYNGPVRPLWNEATWMERVQPVPSTGAASKKCKSLRSGKQVDRPGPCVPSHHQPQLACPGGSSSWHWPLGTAAHRPRERNRDRLWHGGDDQLLQPPQTLSDSRNTTCPH